MATHQPHTHQHGHVQLDEAHWAAFAADTELEGELLLAFVTDTASRVTELRGSAAPPVRRILDIGSGPGVGTCELAKLFPDAHVTAVDGSPAMLDRARERAKAGDLDDRISTHLAELPGGLDGFEPVDLIWASMALHHVGDETSVLRILGELLEPSGLIAIVELGESMRVLPDDLDIGRPGLNDRLGRAGETWFTSMREGLTDTVASTDLASMVTSAGLEIVDTRLAGLRFDPPLSDDARRVVVAHLRRLGAHLEDQLDDEDLDTFERLNDPDDPRGAMHRSDVFIATSRQILIARRRGTTGSDDGGGPIVAC